MSLPKINIVKGNGGLNQPLAGEDHYSGLLFFADTKPSGFATESVKQITDIPSGEALGIVNDKSDETKATGGKVKITTVGNTGSTEVIKMNGVTLGSYVVETGDLAADEADALVVAINLLTYVHGYTATLSTDTVLLTAPSGLGASINGGTHLSFTSDSGGVATVTQFSSGVDAFFDVIHYHMSEFFRINPNGVLFIMIADIPTAYDFSEILEMQQAASGKLRQVGVFVHLHAFSTSDITALQSEAEAMDTEHTPLSLVLAPDITAITDLTDLDDLHPLDAEKVSVIIGEDGNNIGRDLANLRSYSITCLGAMMGAISKSKVSENIAWVANFKMSDIELDVAALSNGTLINTLTENALESIDNKGYIFLRKFVGMSGSYFNYSYTATLTTNDYNTIERNRTIDKGIRGVRTYILPNLNSPLRVDPDTGFLAMDVVKYLEGEADKPLLQMVKDNELSGRKVFINPDQDILSTNELLVAVTMTPVGVAKEFTITLGYSVKL